MATDDSKAPQESDNLSFRDREILAALARHGNKRAAMRAVGASWRSVQAAIGRCGGDGASLETIAAQHHSEVERMRALVGLGSEPDREPFNEFGDDPAEGPEVVQSPERIVAKLRKGPLSLAEVATLGSVSELAAAAWLSDQRAGGLNLQTFGGDAFGGGMWVIERTPPPVIGPAITLESDDDDCFVIGAMGDTHLGSKYERLDVLNDLYDRYAAEGVRHVFHSGNWIDGEAPFNRYDLKVHGMDGQVNYLVREYPRRPGIHTYAVAGDDHEGWYCQKSGVNIGWYAEAAMRKAGREDWTDLGYMEAFVRLVNRRSGQASMLAVVHPGGGSAYALSYTVQKIVESYAGGEKPGVLFAGHYHKMELANIRNVWTVQTGCTQDQTPFMRKKRLEAHVGGHVIRLRQDPRTGAIVEMNGMQRYFNTGYYNQRWSHSGEVNLPKRTRGGV